MNQTPYQIPPWLMQSMGGVPQMPMVQPQFNIPDGAGIPMTGAPMPQTQGFDAQKMAAILGAFAPMASAGQQTGGYGYHPIPQAERGPANPNYRPMWQLQFTPAQGLAMLSQFGRRG